MSNAAIVPAVALDDASRNPAAAGKQFYGSGKGRDMVKLNGAQMVWESLVREGVETVFGIPGGAVIPLYHALPDYPIRHVLMRHEQAAIHAADGYARSTGKVGTCVATSGPGATNLVTGLATAYVASTPVVAITGQAPTPVLGTDAFQEVDIATITMAVTKHNYLITAIQELAEAIKEAFFIARTGRPGPVLIAVTSDVQKSEGEYVYPDQIHLPGYDPSPQYRSPLDRGASVVAPPQGDTEMCQDLLQHICHATRGDVVLVADSAHELSYLGECQPRLLLSAGDLETRGFALPAAIGTQIGLPGAQVWVIARDTALQANIQELATVLQEGLPVRIAVMDRRFTVNGQEKQPGSSGRDGCNGPLVGPDFVMLAEAYGIPGLAVREGDELAPALAWAMAASGPILIDCCL